MILAVYKETIMLLAARTSFNKTYLYMFIRHE